jgi:L-histidine Nalpha-methyltransferase
MTSVA